MVSKLFSKSKDFLIGPQQNVFFAASIIMLMIIGSGVLSLLRQRILAHYFTPNDLSLFFAAFRLPDTVFEILVFGTFSSAFIPVFTKSLSKGTKEAWEIAANVANIGLIIFIIFASIIYLSANPLYQLFAPGYTASQREVIVQLTRFLFIAQIFFVVSYVLTGVLESLRRFLLPALAPLFYNLGIILGAVLFSSKLGLMGPVLGVFLGAMFHFLIQLPLAIKLGFRFKWKIELTPEVKKIGKLALPRIIEVAFVQVQEVTELFFSSLITTAAYTYYTFGNSLQLIPVTLFGTSIAKAALPTLSREEDNPEKFSETLLNAFYQLSFLTIPVAAALVVLRIPLVRLIFGTSIFDWGSTVQTGEVLSAFAFGILFQACASLFARSFYALHDTKTPVIVSIISIILTVILDFVFIRLLHLPVWGLAASFTLGSVFQTSTLYYLINKRILKKNTLKVFIPIAKTMVSTAFSSGVMYFLLKFFDRSVWVKRLSFLSKFEITQNIPFDKFVLDTRYTVNLLLLTVSVSLVGVFVYLIISILLKSKEVWSFASMLKKVIFRGKISEVPEKELEPVAPVPNEGNS